jgi:hypothetical protein
MSVAVAILAIGALLQPGEQAPATHLLVGELTRVDLGERLVALKVGDKAPREVEVALDGETRIVSRGRVLRLEELRAGDPAKVLCVDEGRRHRARVLKTGASRYAAPAPARSPGAVG